ncbi:thiocillin family RiPP [Bacillus sp. N13C7]|uniref:thiocillin family RiPP n=1 Tax=Bacillus sp. N13C7 TaxID=2918909 RepID=UPI002281FBCD|nr:thiocillin family RiPP [Bacillus sp. N13C7]
MSALKVNCEHTEKLELFAEELPAQVDMSSIVSTMSTGASYASWTTFVSTIATISTVN